jgi:hypothetical protein
MARTPDQIAADDALTAAVQAAALVYGWAPDALTDRDLLDEYADHDTEEDA